MRRALYHPAAFGAWLLIAFSCGAQAQPTIGGVANAFSPTHIFDPSLSPNCFAYVYGSNLGSQSSPPQITVNGAQATVYNFTAGDSTFDANFLIPPQTAVGPASIVVSGNGGRTAPFTVNIRAYSPAVAVMDTTGSVAGFRADGTLLTSDKPAKSGEKITIVVTGLGAVTPSNSLLSVTLGGVAAIPESVVALDPRAAFSKGPVGLPPILSSGMSPLLGLTFPVPSTLPSGTYPLIVTIAGASSLPSPLQIVASGLILSQTGSTFRAVSGSATALQRTITIASAAGVIAWSASASTVSGGNWLQVTPASGTSDVAKPAPALQVTASAASLQPGDYYGLVTIKPASATNSAQLFSVVLSVLSADRSPGPVIEPTGLIFISASNTVPAAQTTQVFNPTTSPLMFTTTPSVPSGSVWFKQQPASGTVSPGQPLIIAVQPAAGLSAGVYPGTITFQFSDGSVRAVNLLWVVAPGGSTSAARAAAGCTPTKLLPVLTLLGLNFTSPVAWPTPIQVQITDDCGSPMNAGLVTAGFSNGDAQLGLTPLQNGQWATTWTPRNAVPASLVVTLNAQAFAPTALQGSTTVSGFAPANPNVPIISSGGVVGNASYVASPAPGTLVSIFGTSLADATAVASQLPLPTQLGTTAVVFGGVQIPLVSTSPLQINALVPYQLKTHATYQVIVQRGTAISAPESVTALDSQPAVFTLDQSGKGQGHIYRIVPDGSQVLASPAAPVRAGDVLTVYCAGLGEVQPALDAGSPAPTNELEYAANPVTATIGGVSADVLFAGLTPGFAGLYQVNVTVPTGVTPGDKVPVVLSSAGQISKPVSIAVQ